MFCVKAFLLCTGEMKNANNLFKRCQALQGKKIVEHILNGVYFDLFLSLNEYSVFFGAFCFVKFGNRMEITLCTFRQLHQSCLVRGCNLEVTFLLDHQAQVICQC